MLNHIERPDDLSEDKPGLISLKPIYTYLEGKITAGESDYFRQVKYVLGLHEMHVAYSTIHQNLKMKAGAEVDPQKYQEINSLNQQCRKLIVQTTLDYPQIAFHELEAICQQVLKTNSNFYPNYIDLQKYIKTNSCSTPSS